MRLAGGRGTLLRLMRPIGQLDTEEQARLFADYLYIRDLEAQVEPSPSGRWTIWVVDEEALEEAAGLLSRFRSMPDAEEFYQAATAAEERRKTEKKVEHEINRKMKRPGAFPWIMGWGGLTGMLMVGCILVAILTGMGEQATWIQRLQLSAFRLPVQDPFRFWNALPEVMGGQIWRLWTPIFLHFGLWHLIFNLFWLRDLGTVLEQRIGTLRFAGIVALIALISNLAQFIVSGAGFGGMSGVIYGLFGYLWVRSRMDRSFRWVMAPMMSSLLLLYLGLGLLGLFDATANTAHVFGLLTGAFLGGIAARRG